MKNNTAIGMERVSVKQAADELNIDSESVRYMMRKGTLPIGHVLQREGANERNLLHIQRTAGCLQTASGRIDQARESRRRGNLHTQ